jgi:hypothetical protein
MKRKTQLLTLTLIVFAALLTAVSGPLSNAVELPAAIKRFAFPLLLGFALLLGLIAVLQYFVQEKTESTLLTPSQQNRQQLLARVRTFWIKGVLEQSLHSATLIALGLQEQPDAVALNPLRLYLQQPYEQAQSLPPGTRITQVYDDANGELLILGEPGSGKTTLLLELARELLDRAKSDKNFPMPVVFNLSSWVVKRKSLVDWLVEELHSKYQVPRKLSQSWVDTDQVLPLLDGLDEIAIAYRAACVEAINAFRQEHGLLPVVVCSRSAEYLTLKQHVFLAYAVEVQPLTNQQINEYLTSVGTPSEAVRAALRNDAAFRELATTPLFLNVMTMANLEVPTNDHVVAGSLKDRRQKLFDDYVMAMLQRRRQEHQYSIQQTLIWLRWLAKQLVQHNQSEFYLERLQEDWLPTKRSRLVYRVVLCLIGTLVVALDFTLVGMLVGMVVNGMVDGLVGGLFEGFTIGLLLGLFFGLFFGLQEKIEPAEVITWSWHRVRKQFVSELIGVLLVVLGLVLIAILAALPFVLIGVAISLSRRDRRPTHREIWRYGRYRLVVGLLVGLFVGLVGGPIGALVGMLFFGLVGLLVSGLSREMMDEQNIDIPNQGIWRSGRYGLVFGLIFGMVGAMVGVLVFGLHGGLIFGLVGLLNVGLPCMLIGGLSLGGESFMQYFTLRCFLWQANVIPWNFIRFLDYTADRILLRKVGGGYIFVHRLLLEYFATLDDASIASHCEAKHL